MGAGVRRPRFILISRLCFDVASILLALSFTMRLLVKLYGAASAAPLKTSRLTKSHHSIQVDAASRCGSNQPPASPVDLYGEMSASPDMTDDFIVTTPPFRPGTLDEPQPAISTGQAPSMTDIGRSWFPEGLACS